MQTEEMYCDLAGHGRTTPGQPFIFVVNGAQVETILCEKHAVPVLKVIDAGHPVDLATPLRRRRRQPASTQVRGLYRN